MRTNPRLLGFAYVAMLVSGSSLAEAQVQVASTPMEPAYFVEGSQAMWSEDGSQMVFKRGYNIFSIDSDGSNEVQVTHFTGTEGCGYGSAWGPQIRPGTNEVYWMDDTQCAWYIAHAPMDGSGVRRSTGIGGHNTPMSFSPDGSQFTFAAFHPYSTTHYLRVGNAATNSYSNVFATQSIKSYPLWGRGEHAEQIIYSREVSGVQSAFVYDVGSRTETRVTPASLGSVRHPNWAGDHQIVFSLDWEIYLMSLDDETLVRLTNDEFQDYYPAVSPDGTTVAYSSNRDGTSQTYLIPLGGTDWDGDGIPDESDNCPDSANSDQFDLDGDGAGDACDDDDDDDGVFDLSDNCPIDANSDQTDSDADTEGDACDLDDDNDGVGDLDDNCVFAANPSQADTDADGQGDACDGDDDGDGVDDTWDNCVATPNPEQDDLDGDGEGDVCDLDDDGDTWNDDVDNCPLLPNVEQDDLDRDGIGDVCDADIDGDGVENPFDNCLEAYNPAQDDADLDGLGDACDDDDDDDGVPDGEDNCPFLVNPDQLDLDEDMVGDACDGEVDGDGVANELDNCVDVPNSDQLDFDNDGLGDACDGDIDNDGIANVSDSCGFTEIGAPVDSTTGCSLDQLCPCTGPRGTTDPWKNHGKYVSCVAHTTTTFLEQGVISDEEKEAFQAEAAESSCGKDI